MRLLQENHVHSPLTQPVAEGNAFGRLSNAYRGRVESPDVEGEYPHFGWVEALSSLLDWKRRCDQVG